MKCSDFYTTLHTTLHHTTLHCTTLHNTTLLHNTANSVFHALTSCPTSGTEQEDRWTFNTALPSAPPFQGGPRQYPSGNVRGASLMAMAVATVSAPRAQQHASGPISAVNTLPPVKAPNTPGTLLALVLSLVCLFGHGLVWCRLLFYLLSSAF